MAPKIIKQEVKMGDYQNIVCAVDFSAHGEAACARAIRMARQCGAQLTLLHVVEHFPEDRSNEEIAPECTDPAEFRESRARSGLMELASRLGYNDAAQEVLLSSQSAWHEIVRFAKEHNADLLVLGSHGNHMFSGILGSTANSVINHAGCDVLAVRIAD
jgi:universal stress protein A